MSSTTSFNWTNTINESHSLREESGVRRLTLYDSPSNSSIGSQTVVTNGQSLRYDQQPSFLTLRHDSTSSNNITSLRMPQLDITMRVRDLPGDVMQYLCRELNIEMLYGAGWERIAGLRKMPASRIYAIRCTATIPNKFEYIVMEERMLARYQVRQLLNDLGRLPRFDILNYLSPMCNASAIIDYELRV